MIKIDRRKERERQRERERERENGREKADSLLTKRMCMWMNGSRASYSQTPFINYLTAFSIGEGQQLRFN